MFPEIVIWPSLIPERLREREHRINYLFKELVSGFVFSKSKAYKMNFLYLLLLILYVLLGRK